MKHKLSAEASGTLAALRQKRRLKFFCPETADELISAGFAQKDRDALAITSFGITAAGTIYADMSAPKD